MGIFDVFSRPVRLAGLSAAAPVSLSLESPNQTSSLAKVVYAEYFTGELGEVTRESALQIPALKKARDTYVGILGGMPLREYEGELETTPRWLRNTKSGISTWHRTAYLFDDLFFYDWAMLAVERDKKTDEIVDAIRVPFSRWSVDEFSGKVSVDGKVVSAEQAILIPGNGSGGVLVAGATTIKGYRALERAWVGRAQNPVVFTELHQTDDTPLSDSGEAEDEEAEIQALIDQWSAARTSPTGAVGYTPPNIEVRVHGTAAADMFEGARNAAVLDIARLVGIPASLLDGSQSTASLTYTTTEGKRSEFDDYALPMWTAPIEARLSMDDVSPDGRVIRFDASGRQAVPAPATTPNLEKGNDRQLL